MSCDGIESVAGFVKCLEGGGKEHSGVRIGQVPLSGVMVLRDAGKGLGG